MSQASAQLPDLGPHNMHEFVDGYINPALLALLTNSSGASAPTNGPGGAPALWQSWLDTSTNPKTWRMYVGSGVWSVIGTVDTTTGAFSPAGQTGIIASIAAEATARADADAAEAMARARADADEALGRHAMLEESALAGARELGTIPTYAYDGGTGNVASAERDTLFCIFAKGQSNAQGAVSGAAVATTPLYPGRVLQAAPYFGTSPPDMRLTNGPNFGDFIDAYETSFTFGGIFFGETIITSMLSHLAQSIDAIAGSNEPKFFGFVSAQGSQPLAALRRGSMVSHSAMRAIARATDIAQRGGYRMNVPFWVWMGNESDAAIHTRAEIFEMLRTEAQQQADDILRITGQRNRPVMVIVQGKNAIETQALDQNMMLAQLDAGQTDWAMLAGPEYNFEPGASSGANTIHMTSAGQNNCGVMVARAIFAKMCGLFWKPTIPLRIAQLSSTQIQIDCHAPTPPLVIDIAGEVNPSGLRGVNGFDVQDSSGAFLTISTVAVVNSTSLLLTMAAPITSPWITVGYAMRRNSASSTDDGPVLGARGCVRDSTAQSNMFQTYTSRNWMVAWSKRFSGAADMYLAGR